MNLLPQTNSPTLDYRPVPRRVERAAAQLRIWAWFFYSLAGLFAVAGISLVACTLAENAAEWHWREALSWASIALAITVVFEECFRALGRRTQQASRTLRRHDPSALEWPLWAFTIMLFAAIVLTALAYLGALGQSLRALDSGPLLIASPSVTLTWLWVPLTVPTVILIALACTRFCLSRTAAALGPSCDKPP